MKNEIQEKLNIFLSKNLPFADESQIVYLIVEIRKILEHNNDLKYPLIKFYCDWTLHTKKDRISSVMKQIMNEIYEGIKHEMVNPALRGIHKTKVIGFVYMEDLQEEMEKFFTDNNINHNLTNDRDNWMSFVKIFIKILENQPIINPTNKIKFFCFTPANNNCVMGRVEFVKKEAEYDFYKFGNAY